jgi:hypothetical protein
MSESFKNLMRVIKDGGGDYYINISRDGAEKIKNPVNLHIPPIKYNWLESKVLSKGIELDERLFLTCSNDSSVAFYPGEVILKNEDYENPNDSVVRIFPLALDKLINKEENFLMTRYDRENKLWIYIQN